MFGLLMLSYILYHYFADPQESYFLAMVSVVLSLTVSILCTLLIPVDIYVISEGDITSESLHVRISQDHVRAAYLMLFSALLFLAFCVVPYAYFYGEERGDGDFDKPGRPQCQRALASTAFFVGFMLMLLVVGLNFRPGHTETLDKAWVSEEQAVKWISDLIDIEHKGLNAITFSIACLTSVGVVGWVFYTAYGMAAMPFSWLRARQTATEQREGLKETIAQIHERYGRIKSRYAAREDGSLDLSRVKAVDRKELNRLQREHRSLMQHSSKLEELEQKAGSCFPSLLRLLAPFRLLVGCAMLCMSLLVVLSLLLTLVDRALHSPCGCRCGFTLKERKIFNPADELLLRLSHFFPVDFAVLSVFVLYIFCSSIFGIVCLGIRLLCFGAYALRTRKSMPQALLVLCNVMAYILLALCMALLTIAPNYTAFGPQHLPQAGGSSSNDAWCSLERDESRASCQISVISAFFTRIAIAMPFFSVAYFFANWAFVGVFGFVFARCLVCAQRQPYLDKFDMEECTEEELALLT